MGLGVGENLRRQLHLVCLQQRLANLMPLRLEEGVGHASSDDERIHLGHQVCDDADFVAHLRSAENRDERLLRMRQRLAEVFEFFLHQQAGGFLLHEMGDAFGGSVGAMRRAERVVHVEVAKLSQTPGKLRIVGFLFRVEAQILQQQGLPALQLLAISSACTPMQSGEKPTFSPRRNTSSIRMRSRSATGFRLILGFGLPLGRPRWEAKYEPGAVPQRVLDGGQRLADAGVIHDAAVVERDVEVNPHEDPFIVQRKITNG